MSRLRTIARTHRVQLEFEAEFEAVGPGAAHHIASHIQEAMLRAGRRSTTSIALRTTDFRLEDVTGHGTPAILRDHKTEHLGESRVRRLGRLLYEVLGPIAGSGLIYHGYTHRAWVTAVAGSSSLVLLVVNRVEDLLQLYLRKYEPSKSD